MSIFLTEVDMRELKLERIPESDNDESMSASERSEIDTKAMSSHRKVMSTLSKRLTPKEGVTAKGDNPNNPSQQLKSPRDFTWEDVLRAKRLNQECEIDGFSTTLSPSKFGGSPNGSSPLFHSSPFSSPEPSPTKGKQKPSTPNSIGHRTPL